MSKRGTVAAMGLAGTYVLYVLFLYVPVPFSPYFSSFCSLLASVYLLRHAFVTSFDRIRWIAFGVSCLIYGLADIAWVLWENWWHVQPEESTLLGWVFLIPNGLLLFAVGHEVYQRIRKWNFVQFITNITGAMALISTMLWFILFKEMSGNTSFVMDTILISSLVLDFITVILMMTLYLTLYTKARRIDLWMQFVAIVLYLVADFVFVYEMLNGSYSETLLTDGVYQLSMLILAGSSLVTISNSDVSLDIQLPLQINKAHKRIWSLFAAPVLMILIHGFVWSEFALLVGILFVYVVVYQYVETNMQREELYKIEHNMNNLLEQQVLMRTEELQQTNSQLVRLVRQDTLTSLYNRRYFIERLDNTLTVPNKTVALFVVDLDGFKAINDAHGHRIGDAVLIDLSTRLLKWRPTDTLVARLGGDEFVVLYMGKNEEALLNHLADGLIEIFKQPVSVDPYLFHLSASIGIARYPQDAKDRETLLRYADIAMHRAKANAHMRYIYYSAQLSEKVQRKYEVELLLKKVNFDKEFMLFFQPQFGITDRNLVGMEALLRWKSPEKGMVSPVEFIPIAEETGLIVPLGEWVMHQALRQIKDWNDRYGHDLRMAINISPKQLESVTFMPLLQQLMAEHSVKPWWLDIEITEGSTMNVETRLEEILTALSNLGMSISIDDFGTGYSSLSYIKRFDIDRLKIARELVENIAVDASDLQIVQAIVMMSRGLGLVTIAEGVETEAQLDALVKAGCMEIQGFLLGKPVPALEFEKLYLMKPADV